MNDAPFQIAINQKYCDKVKPGDGRFWRFNMTFQNTRLTLPKLLAAIREGYTWTALHRHKRHHRPTPTNPHYRTTYRVKANVVGSQLLALDSDTGDERSQFDTPTGEDRKRKSHVCLRNPTAYLQVLRTPIRACVFKRGGTPGSALVKRMGCITRKSPIWLAQSVW